MKKLSYLLALAVWTGVSLANADSLNGNGGWQSWNASTLAVDSTSLGLGTPYWNNASGDGPMSNVGWCLTGGGNCSMPAGPQGGLSYYGSGPGSASQMYFVSTGNAVTVSLQTLLTSQTTIAGGYDVVGYYVANSSGVAPSTTSLTPLFNAITNSVGATATINSLSAGDKYGFYIENIQGQGTPFVTNYYYFMDSGSNMATGSMPADSLQHFAAFNAGNGTYFLGDVDADACAGSFQPGTSPCVPSSQFDYNNLMLEVTTNAASTPEPSSLALFGAGSLLIGFFFKSKFRLKNEN